MAPVETVVAAALAQLSLRDIVIENPPLEEVDQGDLSRRRRARRADSCPRLIVTRSRAFATLGALAAFGALGWRRAAADRAGSLGRLAFYWLILAIFWALWRATPLHELGRPGLDASRLFWYMVVTEGMVIAVGFPYRAVEGDIAERRRSQRTGASRTLRPGDAGRMDRAPSSIACCCCGAGGIAAGLWFTGIFRDSAGRRAGDPVSTVLATMLMLLCHLPLGYAAAWVGTPAPLFWIWQKMAFVLGGLMIPLTLYPAPFGSLCRGLALRGDGLRAGRPSCSIPRRGRSSARWSLAVPVARRHRLC